MPKCSGFKACTALLAVTLTGCATAEEIRTKPANLSFSAKARDQVRFASCVQGGLETKEGGQFAISNTIDAQGVTHLTAHIPGGAGPGLFEWDVAISRADTGTLLVERRSNRTVWGGPIGARDVEAIAAGCSN